MPLIYSIHLDNGTSAGIWENEEDIEFFEKNLSLYYEEVNEINELTERKQKEWLSSRYLLQTLMGHNYRLAVVKDHFGKPYLIGTNHHISLSHSGDYTAAVVSKKSTGVDIQYYTEKIIKIKHKFLSFKEMNHYEIDRDLNKLLIYWGAKESLFKAYGKGSVDFKKDLYVHPFELTDKELKAEVYKDDTTYHFTLKFIYNSKFIFVYIV
jgi:phosphopantetheinyl transferase